MYTAPEYQFAERWAVGARYDFTEDPTDSSRHTNAVSAYLTFLQSEFLYWRLGYQYAHSNFMEHEAEDNNTIFLQMDFSLGPHPAHKY